MQPSLLGWVGVFSVQKGARIDSLARLAVSDSHWLGTWPVHMNFLCLNSALKRVHDELDHGQCR